MKNSKLLLFGIFLVIVSSRLVFPQAFEWVKSMNDLVFGTAISTDAAGNSYVTGSFAGTATFGTTQITSYGHYDAFIAKYDASGNLLWVQQAGGTSDEKGWGISTDANGNCYVTGEFQGTARFGSTQIASRGLKDIFIAKYDANGNLLWVKKAGGTGYDYGRGISTDNAGNCFVTGDFYFTATFGSTQITSNGIKDMFIAKYDANGNFLWVQKAGSGMGEEVGYGISIDANGNSYVTGSFMGTATFDTTQITVSGTDDMFIAKYDPSGNFLWVQKAGGFNVEEGKGISTDANGNCYVTGYFEGTATFGSTQITNYGGDDIFIAKYDANGNFLWVQQAGGTTDKANGWGISTDANGNCYVTGYFAGTATFGSTQITSSGTKDMFIAKYDANGNFLWVQRAGGTSYVRGWGISTDANGNCYVIGDYVSDSNFGNLTLTVCGAFITKLGTPTLNIKSPIGGEVWQTYTVHNITWNSMDDGNIKIEITTNNGTNWLTLQNSVQASLGNFTFTVPPFPNSDQCRIRLTSLSYSNVSTSGLFTITSANVPNLTITSPNTEVKWNAGSSQNITWITTESITDVKLEYTTDNGNNWKTITASTPASAGSYNWTIPNAPSTKCRIRISDVSNSLVNDVSDELFTIANISIIAPITGIKWRAQTQKQIEWSSTGVSNINLYYSTDNGTSWTIISNSVTASNGSFDWNLPDLESANCRIKIEDASDVTLSRISDIFEIWKPIVFTQTPLTGQITQSFVSTNITFSAFVMVSAEVTVTYYPYEAPHTGTLPSGVVGVSKYFWNITSSSLSFYNAVISVPIATLTGVNDPSKLVWLKRANSGGTWTNIGGSISGGNLLSVDDFNSFSEFAIGTTDSSNLLLVELYSSDIPTAYVLEQNYPNPFNPSTMIKYQLPKSEFVNLKVYDILGNEVASLVNREQSAGSYEVTFDAGKLSSGVYLYQLRAGEFVSTKKLILIK